MKSGNYQLTAYTYDPDKKKSYTDVQPIIFENKHFSIFIQTDKPIYKPGDLVNFRVFAVDSETRPYDVPKSTITIYDSGDTKIKSYVDGKFVDGKYENSLQLSQEPTLGEWKIKVEAEAEVSLKICQCSINWK